MSPAESGSQPFAAGLFMRNILTNFDKISILAGFNKIGVDSTVEL